MGAAQEGGGVGGLNVDMPGAPPVTDPPGLPGRPRRAVGGGEFVLQCRFWLSGQPFGPWPSGRSLVPTRILAPEDFGIFALAGFFLVALHLIVEPSLLPPPPASPPNLGEGREGDGANGDHDYLWRYLPFSINLQLAGDSLRASTASCSRRGKWQRLALHQRRRVLTAASSEFSNFRRLRRAA